jgi:hypothetical protein
VFSVRSRAVGAVFDELVSFFRPTYSHVREERERLELMREEEGDAAPRRVGGADVTVSVPADYRGPRGRNHPPRRTPQGPVV